LLGWCFEALHPVRGREDREEAGKARKEKSFEREKASIRGIK
jgi:hypothetical protein